MSRGRRRLARRSGTRALRLPLQLVEQKSVGAVQSHALPKAKRHVAKERKIRTGRITRKDRRSGKVRQKRGCHREP